MSLTAHLRDHLQFFEKLLENKHMSDTTNDTNMTGNADNRSELRTNCGHEINHDVQETDAEGFKTMPCGTRMRYDGIAPDGALLMTCIPPMPVKHIEVKFTATRTDQLTPRPGSGFSDPQVPPPPMPSERPTPSEELEIRTCFMGPEFGEIEAVPLFRYRALQRELAEAREQRDRLLHCCEVTCEHAEDRPELDTGIHLKEMREAVAVMKIKNVLGIDVVVDNSLPDGTILLRDPKTGVVMSQMMKVTEE